MNQKLIFVSRNMENRPETLLKQAGSMTKETERQECNNSPPKIPLYPVLPM
jgi:hypothetical protein